MGGIDYILNIEELLKAMRPFVEKPSRGIKPYQRVQKIILAYFVKNMSALVNSNTSDQRYANDASQESMFRIRNSIQRI